MVKYIPERCSTRCKYECPQITSETKYICAKPFYPEMVDIINKWNELTKIIPQKDEYQLETINTWRIFQFELQPYTYEKISYTDFINEAKKLSDVGFNLGFSTENGVGHIKRDGDSFSIQLMRYCSESYPIKNNTLDECLKWIIDFYDGALEII